jgi:hypothetical protein
MSIILADRREATADPSPAEPGYSRGSATQQSDRSRQQPTSVGGGEKKRHRCRDFCPSYGPAHHTLNLLRFSPEIVLPKS